MVDMPLVVRKDSEMEQLWDPCLELLLSVLKQGQKQQGLVRLV